MSVSKILTFDRQGLKNILAEKFVNILFDRSKRGSEIQGCSVNNLLRGLFYLNGCIRDLQSHDLPGGLQCWDDLLESIYITISHFVQVKEVIARVLILCHLYQHSGGLKHGHILTGALIFLYTWAANFNGYLNDKNLQLLRDGIFDVISDIGNASGVISQSIHSTPEALATIAQIEELALQLETMINRLNSERSCMRRGLNISDPMNTKIQTIITAATHSTSNYHLNEPTLLKAPTIPVISGTWITNPRHKDELEPLSRQSSNKSDKLGSMTIEDLVDDEEEYMKARSSSDHDDSGNLILEPRILKGISLLQNPANLSIWSFDVTEIARQWTLIDHALFVAIPLVGLLTPTWTLPRFRAPEGGAAVRRFIDRFNAESTWATQSVLEGESATERARVS